MQKITLSFFILTLLNFSTVLSQGKVYLVIGSDTGIWDGANVANRHNFYNQSLYSDPTRNTALVMDAAYRNSIIDSYGQPIRLTWWMHGGNMFHDAANNNFPLNNTMALYLMKKYHGQAIQTYGDELTLHYHTWAWTDYDRDGIFYWNQTYTFEECREDFDVTLAQYLLEENIFPVSFRSGWHYMDNGWQQHLDKLLPFSLHNDYPSQRTDTTEPLDNTFDWSLAPEEFVPYRPSPQNYQLPGAGRGWNVRSRYLKSVTQTMMDHIFEQASRGVDQVACFWSHLPEADFLDQIRAVDALAHQSDANYPTVKFQYLTAIAAMQQWLKIEDEQPPEIFVDQQINGDQFSLTISTDEPIFQLQPFVAVKDIYQRYRLVQCTMTGQNTWQANLPFTVSETAKAGIAVCDTVGNLSARLINFLPGDLFIDNQDNGYQEIRGNWTTQRAAAWGVDSRLSQLNLLDSAVVRWTPQLAAAGEYNLYFQIPALNNPADSIKFRIFENSALIGSKKFVPPYPEKQWLFIQNSQLDPANQPFIEMTGYNGDASQKKLAADVLKLSALIPERQLVISPEFFDFEEISRGDTVSKILIAENRGKKSATIFDIHSKNDIAKIIAAQRIVIQPFSQRQIELSLTANQLGLIEDSLVVLSNDPLQPEKKFLFKTFVRKCVQIVDNEDSLHYHELGEWNYSVVSAYGSTSRYIFLNRGVGNFAQFDFEPLVSGYYKISEIVPRTENATNYALYEIYVDGWSCDSVYVDQNEGSGNWTTVVGLYLPAHTPVRVRVINAGGYSAGDVLRADAIKINLIREMTAVDQPKITAGPTEFKLYPAYPNPFNPTTTLTYDVPVDGIVAVKIYDILGREMETLLFQFQEKGQHRILFDAEKYSAGLLIVKLEAKGFRQVRKILLIR